MSALDSTFSSSRRTSLPATARILFTLLERMDFGALTLTTPDGITRRFGPGGSVGALDGEVDLTLRDWKLCGDVLTGGDVAFAEAFMDDRWETSNLAALLILIALNQRALEVAFYGRWWRQLVFRAKHCYAAICISSRRRKGHTCWRSGVDGVASPNARRDPDTA